MPLPPNRVRLALLGGAAVLALGAGGVIADMRHERSDRVTKAEALTGGDSERGRALFGQYGCGGCHSVKGVPQAKGLVGPPLDGIAARAIIGGRLDNSPDNLRRWIVDPQAVSPGTAMPRLGVTPEESRHLAAFLYTRT